MKLLLFVLVTIGTVGCVSSQERIIELSAEAKECVDTSTNLAGVIGATSEQRTVCWADANKKLESMAKRAKELEEMEAAKCPRGTTKWCTKRGIGPESCSCVSNWEARRVFERIWY
ncbi:hypothetical protein LCGC14_2811710 [marine sediment metagenome]|uniref:Uncharacterized protein n=1 Tax=marine sediment metagenome TaxID=412755 RepID=A0A0F9BB09_9ZZZZ